MRRISIINQAMREWPRSFQAGRQSWMRNNLLPGTLPAWWKIPGWTSQLLFGLFDYSSRGAIAAEPFCLPENWINSFCCIPFRHDLHPDSANLWCRTAVPKSPIAGEEEKSGRPPNRNFPFKIIFEKNPDSGRSFFCPSAAYLCQTGNAACAFLPK